MVAVVRCYLDRFVVYIDSVRLVHSSVKLFVQVSNEI